MDVPGETQGRLFHRQELPEGKRIDRAPLDPIPTDGRGDPSASRPRADSTPRLAVLAKPSNAGSGLIDLDDIARDLEEHKAQAPDAEASSPREAAERRSPSAESAASAHRLPTRDGQRTVLLVSLALLVVAAGLLAYLAAA
jgi:hypothetical protein